MSFGKDSSIRFVMQDGKLVHLARCDTNADKRPLDSVEEEVWRIFQEYQYLKACHDKLMKVAEAVMSHGKPPCEFCLKLAQEALAAAEQIK